MNDKGLRNTIRDLLADDKGILAMDESSPTCNQRFGALDIPKTEGYRRAYRELIVTTPGLGDYISGAILYDETIRQLTHSGAPMGRVLTDAGIVVGIKVDRGAKPLAGCACELITEGLDGLRERLIEYAGMGARFAKWRAVIAIGEGIPTENCIATNAEALARYAALCQEVGMVPIVEPEVIMDGPHTLSRCEKVTERVLESVFHQLSEQGVMLEEMLLKPNMVLPGKQCLIQQSVDETADATVECLLRAVPAAVPGVMFLSGGQSPQLACAGLNAMHVRFKNRLPWTMSFSFARAIQQPALDCWKGQASNVAAAQRALLHRARLSHFARRGQYCAAMENADPGIGEFTPAMEHAGLANPLISQM
jgi:fructose-bisphosphate aldolase class I